MSQRTGLAAGLFKLTLLGVLLGACGARVEPPPGAQAHADVRPVAWAYAAAILLGVLVSVPYWRAMGLLP